MNIGKRIKSIRMGKGFSRECLAEVSGVPYGTLCFIEQKSKQIDLEKAYKLADALGVSVDEFRK